MKLSNLMVKIFGLSFLVFFLACQTVDRRTRDPIKQVKDIPLDPKTDAGIIKKRLMILPFIDSKGQLSSDFQTQIKKSLIKQINESKEIIAFDSKDLGIDKLKLSVQGRYDVKDLMKNLKDYSVHSALEFEIKEVKIRRSIPAKGIIKPAATEYEASIVSRVINQNGRDLFNHMKVVTYKDSSVSGTGNESMNQLVSTLIKDAIFEFVPMITKSLDTIVWEGRIASIQGERIFLNVGKVSGLNMGDLLRVTEDGEEIFDTETGQFVGKSPGRLKGTLEVVSFFGQDGAIAVIHSGGGFRENDRIELY